MATAQYSEVCLTFRIKIPVATCGEGLSCSQTSFSDTDQSRHVEGWFVMSRSDGSSSTPFCR
jgi:hypothetical protein